MTAKPHKTTLDDIAKSIDDMQSQINGIQTQMVTKDDLDATVSKLVTRDDLDAAIANLVTKDEFNSSISRLEATIRREAGDLGESIASLTNMVAKEFDSLTITRLKPARLKARHIKTARPRAAERD